MTADSLEQQRRANRDAIRALGLDPYGRATPGIIPLADARALYDPDADLRHKESPPAPDTRPAPLIAGRVVLHRDNGKLVWMNLRDDTADLQIAVSQRDCDHQGFGLAKLTDLGDLLIARGPLARTKTGEITLWATSLRPAAKSLAPPPEKHAGLQDVELRYRQRYVDLWANPRTLHAFQLRSGILARIRAFLHSRGYVEVETPMLQALAGGAAARPFTTHLNALDIDLFLRVAPELYLKRLLVGGLPRVFELNRNFRNEGLDKQHNPEFTMLEAYQAYGDCESIMGLSEDLIRDAAAMGAPPASPPGPGLTLPPLPPLPFGDLRIDYARPFDRIRYADLFQRALDFELHDHARVRRAVIEYNLARKIKSAAPAADDQARLESLDPILLANTLFEQIAERSLDPARPTFITHYPAALSPLTRISRDDPAAAERADLFIAHMEIGPHYTELNDPDIQERTFRSQLAGADLDEQTFRTFDHDFIRALKVGMPPAGGLGLGIDRLVMLLTDQRTIRDAILFPFMRPE